MELPMLSFWSRRVLFCEGVLNTVSALLMIFAPAFVLTQLGMTSGVDGAHLSITQQLGSIILILGYIGLRAPVTKENVEALLLGDIAYLIVFIPFVNAYAKWTPGSLFSVGSVSVLIIARLVFLYTEYAPLYNARRHPPTTSTPTKRSRARSPRRSS